MKIGDLCTYAPKSSIKAGEAINNGKYMFFTSGADENKRYSDYQLDCEAIIMGTGGNATLHYYNGKFSTSTDCVVLIPNEYIRCKYLYYFFLCNMVTLENGFKGAGLKHTNKNYISNIEIYNVPNIETQDKIIKALNMVFGIKFYYQQQLQKLDELVKSRFIEMFGDPLKNDKGLPMILGEALFKLSNGKALPNSKRFTEGIPAYGGNGVSWYTDEVLCDYDTIIIGRVGFQSGNVHLAEAPLWVTDNAMYISNIYSKDCDIRFLCALMEHLDFTRYQDAGDLKKITQKPFMQMQYLMPPISLQKQYIAFVEQVDKSKIAVQQALDKAQLLFDSLMQKYFG